MQQVTVETMLVESKATAKAILDLISVANVTSLVMGTKLSPPSRYKHLSILVRLFPKEINSESQRKKGIVYMRYPLLSQAIHEEVVESRVCEKECARLL